MPTWAQLNDGVVEINTDAATHTHDHRFTFNGLQTLLKMRHNILGYQSYASLGANNGLQARPLTSILFLDGNFFALRDLLKLWINLWPFLFIEGQLRQSSLVVNAHSG